ncbi:hypothetical protein [Burkholderia cenocepacia]|uniref:hypothetical protein n=1 Tax=Burkholderia cenocepacia TaxID=95486 RepID=UPI0026560F73|nr:hypothetical protein [Burkholderia cenocepacia]MDN7678028.1 hypothetical protein [Burkholderia cenocepacia]
MSAKLFEELYRIEDHEFERRKREFSQYEEGNEFAKSTIHFISKVQNMRKNGKTVDQAYYELFGRSLRNDWLSESYHCSTQTSNETQRKYEAILGREGLMDDTKPTREELALWSNFEYDTTVTPDQILKKYE